MRKYYVTCDTSLYHTFLFKRGLAVSRIRNFSAVAPNAERESVFTQCSVNIGNPAIGGRDFFMVLMDCWALKTWV